MNLTSRQQDKIKQILQLHHDANAETIVDDALELLLNERKLSHLQLRLTESVREAERGDSRELTPELVNEIRTNAREKHRLRIAPDPDVIP